MEDRISEINKMIALKTVSYKNLNDDFEQLQNLVRDFVTESEQLDEEHKLEQTEKLNENRD